MILNIWVLHLMGVYKNTQNRTAEISTFFSLHYLLPFVIAALTALHLTALHQAGSSNPLGTISNTDKIPFHPYFTVKDLFGAIVFVMFFSLITFGIYKSCKNGTCNKPVESGG